MSSVFKILREYKSIDHVQSPKKNKPKLKTVIHETDDVVKSAIRRKVHGYFFNNDLPTVDKILRTVNDDEDLPNFKRTTMYHLLKNIGFKFDKRNRTVV